MSFIKEFQKEYGKIIIKPLYAFGGRDVFLVEEDLEAIFGKRPFEKDQANANDSIKPVEPIVENKTNITTPSVTEKEGNKQLVPLLWLAAVISLFAYLNFLKSKRFKKFRKV